MSLAVTESGSGDPLVVFVHGVLDRGASFARVAARLAAEHRVVCYDRRGYGASASTSDPVGVEGHIADLVGVLNGRRAVVVGHSFGGVPALGAAVSTPELVRAVVLYETSLAWAPGWDDSIMQGVYADADPEGTALHLMLGDRYTSMGEDERMTRRRDARVFLAEERSVRTGTPPYDVAAIRAPVVYGRSGPDVMPSVVAFLQDEVAGIDVVTLPGAGHYAHRSAPDAFVELVRRGVAAAATA